MFQPERKTQPAAVLTLSPAAPAAGIASPLPEAFQMPAAPFYGPLFFAAPFSESWAARPVRQHAIGPAQCRWIIADADAGAEALMCAAPVVHRRPFCAAHCAAAYMPRDPDEDVEGEAAEEIPEETTEQEDVE